MIHLVIILLSIQLTFSNECESLTGCDEVVNKNSWREDFNYHYCSVNSAAGYSKCDFEGRVSIFNEHIFDGEFSLINLPLFSFAGRMLTYQTFPILYTHEKCT